MHRFTIPVRAVAAALTLVFVVSAGVEAQIPRELPPPAEFIQGFRADYAPLLTEERQWPMDDGTDFTGSLCQWYVADGVVAMGDRHGRTTNVPLRQFSRQARKEIESLLKPHAEQIKSLRAKRRAFRWEGWELASYELRGASVPIDVTETHVAWGLGTAYFRTPLSVVGTDELKEITSALEDLNSRTFWDTAIPQNEFAADLVGQTETAFVLRNLQAMGARYAHGDVLLAKSALSESDRERAEQILSGRPDGGVVPADEVPRWWCWLSHFGIEGTIQPIELTEGQVRCEVQGPVQEQKLTTSTVTRPLESFEPLAALELRLLLAEKERQKSDPSLSPSELADWRTKKRQELIAENPLVYLSPVRSWPLRDRDPDHPFEGRLVGERKAYWIFAYGDQETPVALRKEELASDRQELANQTVHRLDVYFAAHPEATRPSLETDFRVVRWNTGGLNALRPLDVSDYGSIHCRRIGPRGKEEMTQIGPDDIHFIDAQELKLVLSGGTLDDLPADPDLRRLEELREQPRSWAMKYLWDRPVQTGNIGLTAALVGEYQGSLIMRKDDVAFLIDRGLLAQRSLDQADRLLAQYEEMRGQKETVAPDVPKLRLWGLHGTKLVGPGTNPRFNASGDLEYTDAKNTTQTVRASDLPATVAVELRTYVEGEQHVGTDRLKSEAQAARADDPPATVAAEVGTHTAEDKQVDTHGLKSEAQVARTDDPPATVAAEVGTHTAEDKQVDTHGLKNRSSATEGLADLTRGIRERLEKEIEASQPRVFRLAESASHLRGHFVQFDGDDAIFRLDRGRFVRVYPFQLTDETLAELEQIAANSSTPQLAYPPPQVAASEVTARWLRPVRPNGHLQPGTPVALDGQNIYFRMFSGAHTKLALRDLHPRDAAEIRGDLYRKDRGIERDADIDDRLRQPVAADEKLTGAVPLAEEWKQRLDGLLQAPERRWDTHPLALAANEKVLALSADGSQVLVFGATLEIADSRGENRKELRFSINPRQPAFLTADGRAVIGFSENKLVQWDTASGRVVATYEGVKESPAATTQSLDGMRIFFVSAAGQIEIIEPLRRTHATVTVETDAQTPRWTIASSPDGSRFAVVDGANIHFFGIDEAAGEPRGLSQAAIQTTQPVIALSADSCVLGDAAMPAVLLFDFASSTPAVVTHATGLFPAWIGIEATNGFPTFQVIGKRADVPPQFANESYSATFGMDRSRTTTPQTLEHLLSPASLVAASGVAIAYESDGRWFVARRGPLSGHPLKPLSDIAEELIYQRDVGQIEAAWEYLRSEPFHKIGAYPDQASEGFLDYLNAYLQRYGWEHGGDLRQRAELLLERWTQVAPNSAIVPTLSAMYWRDRAWEARGAGFADSVSRKGSELFEQHMRTAAQLIKPVLGAERPPTRAYSLTFEISMSLNLPLSTTRRLTQRMMKTPLRSSTSPHQAVVLLMLPRWHGQPGDSERYIRAVADHLGGPEGDAMYAQLILHAANFYPKNQPVNNFLEVDLDRLWAGLHAHYVDHHADELLAQALPLFALEQRMDLYKEAMLLSLERQILPEFSSNQAWIAHRQWSEDSLAAQPPSDRPPSGGGE